MIYLLPPNGRANELWPSNRVCIPSQQITNKTDISSMLYVKPGDAVVLRYQENGHITLPNTSPDKRSAGTVYVYGTGELQLTDTLLIIYKIWDASGTGGDGRGRFLAQRGFDDGECYSPINSTIARERAL